MKKKWHILKNKIPENEELGTFFEIKPIDRGFILKEDDGVYVVVRDEFGELDMKAVSFNRDCHLRLLSDWGGRYGLSKWRCVTDKAEITMYQLLDL